MAKGGKNQKANPKSKTSMKKAMQSAAKIVMITLAQMMEVFARASLEFKDTLMMSLSKKKAYASDLWTECGSISTIDHVLSRLLQCKRTKAPLQLFKDFWQTMRTQFPLLYGDREVHKIMGGWCAGLLVSIVRELCMGDIFKARMIICARQDFLKHVEDLKKVVNQYVVKFKTHWDVRAEYWKITKSSLFKKMSLKAGYIWENSELLWGQAAKLVMGQAKAVNAGGPTGGKRAGTDSAEKNHAAKKPTGADGSSAAGAFGSTPSCANSLSFAVSPEEDVTPAPLGGALSPEDLDGAEGGGTGLRDSSSTTDVAKLPWLVRNKNTTGGILMEGMRELAEKSANFARQEMMAAILIFMFFSRAVAAAKITPDMVFHDTDLMECGAVAIWELLKKRFPSQSCIYIIRNGLTSEFVKWCGVDTGLMNLKEALNELASNLMASTGAKGLLLDHFIWKNATKSLWIFDIEAEMMPKEVLTKIFARMSEILTKIKNTSLEDSGNLVFPEVEALKNIQSGDAAYEDDFAQAVLHNITNALVSVFSIVWSLHAIDDKKKLKDLGAAVKPEKYLSTCNELGDSMEQAMLELNEDDKEWITQAKNHYDKCAELCFDLFIWPHLLDEAERVRGTTEPLRNLKKHWLMKMEIGANAEQKIENICIATSWEDKTKLEKLIAEKPTGETVAMTDIALPTGNYGMQEEKEIGDFQLDPDKDDSDSSRSMDSDFGDDDEDEEEYEDGSEGM
eukprot:g7613.t1